MRMKQVWSVSSIHTVCQVEGVADLINADTSEQRKLALRQVDTFFPFL